MTEQSGAAGPVRMTAAHVAVAIVAACGVTGTRPDRAFESGDGQGRTRVMAAAGCIARLGWTKAAAARVFRVHPNRLTPSGRQLARVWTEHLLVVAEALAAHGLASGAGDVPGHATPAAEATAQRKAGGGQAETETGVRARADAPVGSASAVTAGRRAATAAGPVRRGAAAARAGLGSGRAERLRPVTDRVIRWSRQQLALGADVEFLAWCFSVDVAALTAGVRPDVGVAA